MVFVNPILLAINTEDCCLTANEYNFFSCSAYISSPILIAKIPHLDISLGCKIPNNLTYILTQSFPSRQLRQLYCNQRVETDHLFYQCVFSRQVWHDALFKCNHVYRCNSWQDQRFKKLLEDSKGRGLVDKVRRIAFAAALHLARK